MQQVLDGVAAEVAPLVATAGRPRRVACLEWNDPLMGCGHWCTAAGTAFLQDRSGISSSEGSCS